MWSVVFYTLPSFVPILRHLLLLKGYNPESCSHNPENHICTKSNAYVCEPYFTIRITANYTAHEGRGDNKRYLKIYILKLLLEKRFELGSYMKFSKTIYEDTCYYRGQLCSAVDFNPPWRGTSITWRGTFRLCRFPDGEPQVLQVPVLGNFRGTIKNLLLEKRPPERGSECLKYRLFTGFSCSLVSSSSNLIWKWC